jgi:hypothetical protein
MSAYDISSSIAYDSAFNTAAIATDTTTNGEIIDTLGYQSLDFAVLSGTLTDGAYTITLEDGDAANLSDASTVASTSLVGSLPAFADTEDNTVKHVGYVGKKRYVRLSIVSTSTSSGGTFSAVALKGNAASRPTS